MVFSTKNFINRYYLSPITYPLRKYEPIWKELKLSGKAALTAKPQLHARIKKAVIKEKDNDLAFKLSASEGGKKYKLSVASNGQVLSFLLEDSILLNIL